MKLIPFLSLLLLCTPAIASPRDGQAAADLQELRGQIQQVQKQLAEKESDRDEIHDTLKQSERAISDANRTLETLLLRQRELSRSSQDLARSIATRQRELTLRRAQVAKLFRQRYRNGAPSSWQLWLNAENPNELARNRRYAEYWIAAQQAILRKLQQETRELELLLGNARNQEEELRLVAEQQKQQQRILLSEQQAREQALKNLSRQIASQKQQLNKLQRDERQLAELVTRLAQVAKARAEQRARRARERERELAQARRKANPPREQARGTTRSPRQQPAVTVEKSPQPPLGAGQFAALRGRMALPVAGEIGNRYGQGRAEGGNWKGVFIRVASGRSVNAIARGEVVFADWLRGFGNLIIIDHGEGYMSLYGYNETLLKQVGDAVNPGERIAVTGASGGQSEPGLYFEIRYQGRPLDPLVWTS